MEKKKTGRVGRRERRDSRICNALSGGKASFCTLAAAMRNGSPAYRNFAPLNATEQSKLLGTNSEIQNWSIAKVSLQTDSRMLARDTSEAQVSRAFKRYPL